MLLVTFVSMCHWIYNVLSLSVVCSIDYIAACKAHVELMYPIYLYNSFCFISRDMLWPYCDADPVRVTVINKPSEQLSPKYSFTDTNQWSIVLHLHLRAGGRIPNGEFNQLGVQAMHLWSELEGQKEKNNETASLVIIWRGKSVLWCGCTDKSNLSECLYFFPNFLVHW